MVCRAFVVFGCGLALCLGSAVNGAVGPFSLGAARDIELGNDGSLSPDGRSNGSGLGIRDISTRRRVTLISYDTSKLLGPGEWFADVSFSHFSYNLAGEVNVYGVLEDLDLFDVETLTWNTAPGLPSPAPPLDSPVAIDAADLTGVLLTFTPPVEVGVRFSTDPSAALTAFLNSNTDGIVTFLLAPGVGAQTIIRSSEHSSGGSLLQGQIVPEPATLGLLGLGGLALLRRRKP